MFVGFLLFAPTNWLDVFGLSGLVSQFRPHLGGIFLLSMSIEVVVLVTGLWRIITEKIRQSQLAKSRIKRLHKLTPQERLVLQGYINQNTRSAYFYSTNGDVVGLVKDGILYQASDINAHRRMGYAGTTKGLGSLERDGYNIEEWAWEYLNKNTELVKQDALEGYRL